jgi:hypothetical protein
MKLSCARLGTGRGASAYTLVEVIVAVLVLTTIAVAYYSGLSWGFAITQSSREELRATQILVQKVEGLRLCNWRQLSEYSFREHYDPLGTTNQTGGAVYLGTVKVTASDHIPSGSSYRPNMVKVTVALYWTNYNRGRPLVHTRQTQTQVARYGIQDYIWGAE